MKVMQAYRFALDPTPAQVRALRSHARPGSAVGIDLGVKTLLTGADDLGELIEITGPRPLRASLRKLRHASRSHSRKVRGSANRRKSAARLARVHARVANVRTDALHKATTDLTRRYETVVVEDLNVKGLAAGMLSKSVHDAGWSSFIAKLSYKAANAGRQLIAVNPAGTSQTCLCGASVPKLLSDREHVCIECRLVAPRDVVSAQVILQRARISPSSVNVEAFSSCVA